MPYKDYEKAKANARANYWKNKELRLQQSREYYYANWEKKQAQRNEWIRANPESAKISKAKYAKKRFADPATPQKSRAYNKVQWALKKGRLTRRTACEVCPETQNIQAHHHKGYSDEFALDVRWLCKLHHEAQHHAVNRTLLFKHK